jgi:hypothetical protein
MCLTSRTTSNQPWMSLCDAYRQPVILTSTKFASRQVSMLIRFIPAGSSGSLYYSGTIVVESVKAGEWRLRIPGAECRFIATGNNGSLYMCSGEWKDVNAAAAKATATILTSQFSVAQGSQFTTSPFEH